MLTIISSLFNHEYKTSLRYHKPADEEEVENLRVCSKVSLAISSISVFFFSNIVYL